MRKTIIALAISTILLTGCTSQETTTQQQETTTQTVNLQKETDEYKEFVKEQIDMLLTDTENWAKVLESGNIQEAKAQYPLIRMAYERSEPIAESFGELDIKIDFRLVDFKDEYNTEEGWGGFHKIEQILWEQNTTEGTQEYAQQLVNDIKELKAKILTVEVTPDLMLTGAVDLLNEVATSKITGEEEVWSHTDLYDFKANIEGAEKIFELFKPVLETKNKELVQTLTTEFKTVNDLLDQYNIDDNKYKLYTELTSEDTKKLAEAVTKLGEPLSQMGIVVEATK